MEPLLSSRVGNVDALIQIPIIDLRSFLATPTGKLARPGWPVGIVGDRAGDSQFMRRFSSLQSTHGSETGSWQGRAQHVDARSAFRLPADFGWTLRKTIAAAAAVDRYSSEFHATCLNRSFYGSQTSPRNFMQLRLRLNDPVRYRAEHWEALVTALLDLPVRVEGDGEVPLSQAAGPLARCIRLATTKTRFNGKVPTWAVTSGRPLLVLETAYRAKDEMPSTEPDLSLDGSNADLWLLEKPGVDICVVANRSERKRSRSKHLPSAPALHLSRLHSERVTLTKLANALVSHRQSLAIGSNEGTATELLQAAFEEVTCYLKRTVAFGNDQRALLELLDSDLALHAAEWDALNRTLASALRPVAKDVVAVFNLIEGDNVEGDKFENISGSTIINRSTVQESFNALDEASLGTLKVELEELIKEVEGVGDPEALEVVEAFVEEGGGPRRQSVLKGLWSRLQELAPVVAGFATAGTAIAKVLLGIP